MTTEKVNRIFNGASGWVYKEWGNDFYHYLKPMDQFRFYATQFPAVEINATFYRPILWQLPPNFKPNLLRLPRCKGGRSGAID